MMVQLRLDKLYNRHLGSIAIPGPQFQDSGVSACSVCVTDGNIVKDFLNHLGVRHLGQGQTAVI